MLHRCEICGEELVIVDVTPDGYDILGCPESAHNDLKVVSGDIVLCMMRDIMHPQK